MANDMAQKDVWALPPIEKIYEAYSAVADGRVKMLDGCAFVLSSDQKKEYTVEWNNDIYSSNDNASYWQGYIGYPLIAVLMLQERLIFDKAVAACFKGVNWKEINTRYKNQYDKAAGAVFERLASEGADVLSIRNDAASVYEQLKVLSIKRRRGRSGAPAK
jgi:hypothetical protein